MQQVSDSSDAAHLESLGYEQKFDRKMSLWSNLALGFLYLSPLVSVVAMFAQGLATAGPPSMFWIIIVGGGQLLVALIFGEIVAQYPIAGGLYQWARRLWSGKYAWMLSWIYLATVVVAIATTAMFSSSFVANLFTGTSTSTGAEVTPGVQALIAGTMLAVGVLLNMTGTKTLARIAGAGLAAELVGVVAVGLYLLVFERHQPFSVFFDTMGTGGNGGYFSAFIGAALVGLLMVYGFEACGEVAEEVPNPGRRIPQAMILTVVVGAASALLSFAGYVLAAPNLQEIVDGDVADPIPVILQDSIGLFGTKAFMVIALTSFLACVMGQQAAASRLVFSFARDNMFPGSHVFSKLSKVRHVPVNAIVGVNLLSGCILAFVYFFPESLFRVASMQMLAGYVAFQMVVFAALRSRLRGWNPAGSFTLGRAGLVVNIGALVYGVLSILVLARPSGDPSLAFVDRWIAVVGFAVVTLTGLAYLLIAKPEKNSTAPEGDAIEVANAMRARRAAQTLTAQTDEDRQTAAAES
ncbi:APC family permease [Rhodococcus koreensis]|uniref:Amino acid transporter n=1 Tax=Rhodococcus koreensis TaxID=99653 RepID=A0A1H4IGI1_9NOCA|nr:amino acid permease [Rhodococcus koreensis]SEB33191.1 Amino acid transporter [Rhodococcus koreensis]